MVCCVCNDDDDSAAHSVMFFVTLHLGEIASIGRNVRKAKTLALKDVDLWVIVDEIRKQVHDANTSLEKTSVSISKILMILYMSLLVNFIGIGSSFVSAVTASAMSRGSPYVVFFINAIMSILCSSIIVILLRDVTLLITAFKRLVISVSGCLAVCRYVMDDTVSHS